MCGYTDTKSHLNTIFTVTLLLIESKPVDKFYSHNLFKNQNQWWIIFTVKTY